MVASNGRMRRIQLKTKQIRCRWILILGVALGSLMSCSLYESEDETPLAEVNVDRPDYPGFFGYLKYVNPLVPITETQSATPDHPVIRLLGFDGVGWPELNLMLGKHGMPGLRLMLRKGAAAVLRTDTSESPVAWTTIACGKDRYQHGILTYAETKISPFTYTKEAIKVPRVWDIFNYHNLTTRVAKYFFVPNGSYETQIMESQCRMAIKDVTSSNTDFFATYVEATDYWQHQGLVGFHLRENEWGKNFSVDEKWLPWVDGMAQALVGVFNRMDDLIGHIVALYPDDYLIIVSDHGMGVDDLSFQLEIDVEAKWFLPNRKKKALTPDSGESTDTVKVLEIEPGYRLKMVEETTLQRIAIHKKTEEEMLVTFITPRLTITTPKGVDPVGADQLRKELLDLNFFEAKVFNEEPDGSLTMTEEMIRTYLMVLIPGRPLDAKPQYQIFRHNAIFGWHTIEDQGIFMAYGPTIKQGATVSMLDLVDVTPTLLYLAGLPVGKDMQGKVATSIILPETLKKQPISFIDSYDQLITESGAGATRGELSQEQRKAYRESGYPGLD